MATTWYRTAALVLPVASIGFGFILCLVSCVYLFGAVGLQTTTISKFKLGCAEDVDPGSYNTLLCRSLMDEIAAGIIGLLFGLVQIGIGAAMFVTKEKPQLRITWAAANIISLVFILTAAVLPLLVYSSYAGCIRPRRYDGGQGSYPRESPPRPDPPDRLTEKCAQQSYEGGKFECVRHMGCNQLSISGANALVLIYGIIGILDAIFIFVNVVILASMYQPASDSPGGYNPPGSARSVEPMPSIYSQTANVPQAAHSQVLSS